jgi:CubicO group peptidase (beta-lactamase class C family)
MKRYLAVLALLAPLAAQPLPETSPENVGLSKERLGRIKIAMDQRISANDMAGGVGLIARKGKVAYFETYGLADKESGKPMRKDAIFRIYSMTKAVTGVAVMTLYEEGRFALTDPVSKYLPEFEHASVAIAGGAPVPASHPITILDLMRHTSGLDYVGPKDEKGEFIYRKLNVQAAARDEMNLAELIKKIASTPLIHQPGTTFEYGFSIDVLGRLVEVISGKPLDEYFAERIFQPLHMTDTSFYVPEEKWSRLATLYTPDKSGTIHRFPASSAQDGYKTKPKAFMGGAGLTSTAMDYARFIQMLLNGGQLDGVRILSPKTVEFMRSDALGDMPRSGTVLKDGYGFGLTFAVNKGPGKTGAIGSAGEYNWGGAAGTKFWIDPKEQLIGVFMIQNLPSGNHGEQFKQLAYQAIVE